MAKKSMIAREKKRAALAAKLGAKRKQLKEIISSTRSDGEQVEAAVVALQKMPRDAGRTRGQRRCQVSGRPHAVYRKFGLCRNKLREAAMRGDVPGLVKASW
jgi:small subunit ribosomal protein S14